MGWELVKEEHKSQIYKSFLAQDHILIDQVVKDLDGNLVLIKDRTLREMKIQVLEHISISLNCLIDQFQWKEDAWKIGKVNNLDQVLTMFKEKLDLHNGLWEMNNDLESKELDKVQGQVHMTLIFKVEEINFNLALEIDLRFLLYSQILDQGPMNFMILHKDLKISLWKESIIALEA